MRRGSRVRPWTVGERRRLAELAGRVPVRDICRELRRSRSAVTHAAAELRAQGVPADLRCHRPSTEICPSCGCARSLMGRDGICEVCRRREQLARIEAETSDLLARLPPAERALYEDTEAERGSSAGPMPALLPTTGVSRYRAARNAERNDLAMERWSVTRLRRLVKAAQKRKERIRAKVARMDGNLHG